MTQSIRNSIIITITKKKKKKMTVRTVEKISCFPVLKLFWLELCYSSMQLTVNKNFLNEVHCCSTQTYEDQGNTSKSKQRFLYLIITHDRVDIKYGYKIFRCFDFSVTFRLKKFLCPF